MFRAQRQLKETTTCIKQKKAADTRWLYKYKRIGNWLRPFASRAKVFRRLVKSKKSKKKLPESKTFYARTRCSP